MTTEEKQLIKTVAKVKIYYPGKAKRFLQEMNKKRRERPGSDLSPRQYQFLCDLVHTYRRQLPAEFHKKYCKNEKCIKEMQEQKALSMQLLLF